MRICVAMFGLNRSLCWTHRSIKNCLLLPLQEAGVDVAVYGHFNMPQSVDNPRSGEKIEAFSNRGIDLIDFDQLELEAQRDEMVLADHADFMQHDLQCNDPSGATHRNVLHQYRSLKLVMRLIERYEGDAVDGVVFARPDLYYLDRLPVADVLSIIQKEQFDLLTPTWHRWGGLNDRLAFCSWRAAKVYASRYDLISEIVLLNQPMNSESILNYTVQKYGLRNGDFSMRAARVRSGGRVRKEGFDLDLRQKLFFKYRNGMYRVRDALGV